MAEEKITKSGEPAKKKDDRVELFVPRSSNNKDPNLVIVLNGKNYVLPKGQKSMVPRAVKREYERSQRAQYTVDNAIYDMVEKSTQSAKNAGLEK